MADLRVKLCDTAEKIAKEKLIRENTWRKQDEKDIGKDIFEEAYKHFKAEPKEEKLL